ncbi:transcription elongation GreA/GreB family factor [Bradyrhizobium sp. i1.8.4]|uniref:hypothetical protein n=1 Tax=unclassified Bradyrhizobium TaxID=2631580 RepID=UPI003D251462
MLALKVAGIERRAFRQQRLGQFENAIQTLEKLIADKELADDAERRAWALSVGHTHRLSNRRRRSRPEASNERLHGQQQSFAAEGQACLRAASAPG